MSLDQIKYATMLFSEFDALPDSDKMKFLSSIIQTGIDTFRKSIDGTKAVVKWRGEDPLAAFGIIGVEYSRDGIIQLMDTPEWNTGAP